MRSSILIILLVFQSVACTELSAPKPIASQDGWVKISENSFQLSIPPNLLKENLTGTDTFYQRYSGGNISLTIESETGVAELAKRLNGKDLTNVKRMAVENHGSKSLLAQYEFLPGHTNFQDPDKRFAMELAVDCNLQSRNTSFLVLYAHQTEAPVAEAILRSVVVDCG